MSLTLNELLRSNAAPTEEQTIEIQSAVAKLQHDLHEVDQAIARVPIPPLGGLWFLPKPPPHNHQSVLLRHKLFVQKDGISQLLQDHVALFSPIRRLPAELLQLIFLDCLPTDRIPLLYPSEAPLLLCHVCSGWRVLALNTPELWKTLSFAVPDMPVPPIRSLGNRAEKPTKVSSPSSALASVNLWLQNAPSSPISFCFASSQNPLTSRFFSAFALQGHRWRCATIKISASEFSLPVTMHALHSLRLEFPTTDIVDWDLFNKLSTCTPNLQQLTLLCDGFRFIRHNLSLEPLHVWSQLTRLHLFPTSTKPQYMVQLHDTLEVLRYTPKLAVCSLHMMFSRVSLPLTTPEVVLNDLVSLHLFTDQSLGWLLDRLVLPSIRDIQLDCGEDLFGWPQPEFTAFVAKADFQLVRFGVRSRTMRAEELVECLEAMPMVRCLELGIQDGVGTINDRVLDSLMASRGLLPRLAILALSVENQDGRSMPPFSDKALVEMVRTRCGEANPLRELRFGRSKGFDERYRGVLMRGCGNLQVHLQTGLELFTPANTMKAHDRLRKIMSNLEWNSDRTWEAYET